MNKSAWHIMIQKRRMAIIISFIIVLSSVISVFISTKNYKTGLLLIGGIFFLSVLKSSKFLNIFIGTKGKSDNLYFFFKLNLIPLSIFL